MGNTKQILDSGSEGIPEVYLENARNCFMCGKEVDNGGTWAGLSNDHLVTVCPNENCIANHIKWVIDTFLSKDQEDIKDLTTKQKFINFVEKVYIEKSEKTNFK